jgi:hypothetical protein
MRRVVAQLRLGEQWYRLSFECATFFWEASDNPETPQNGNLACGLLFNDLSGIDGVVGHTIREVNYEASQSGDGWGHGEVQQWQAAYIQVQL